MELSIKIIISGKTLIVQDNTNYLPEGAGSKYYSYEKKDCASLIIIESHRSSDTKNPYSQYSFENQIDINKDMWLTLHYVILPTKEYVYNNIELYNEKDYNFNFYISNNELYLYHKNTTDEKINPSEFFSLIPNEKSNVLSISKEYVSIHNLYECYIDFCQQLFQNRGFSKCWNKNTVDSELVYKRDLVWMAINVVDYLVDLHEKPNPTLEEAERIIELIHSCTGVCSENNDISNRRYGCGCSKK